MKYDANDYLRRKLESKEGMNEESVKLYLSVLSGLMLKDSKINNFPDNSMRIYLEYSNKEFVGITWSKKIFSKVDKNNNLTIGIDVESREKRIEWNIGFDGKHYEISIFNNLYSQDDHDMYSGIYYINKDKSGLITQKFYSYDAYDKLNGYHISKDDEMFFYNPNYFYCNGFNPDYLLVQETNNQISEEQLATELNDIIKNMSVEYSLGLFKKFLSDYKQKDPEINLVLK